MATIDEIKGLINQNVIQIANLDKLLKQQLVDREDIISQKNLLIESINIITLNIKDSVANIQSKKAELSVNIKELGEHPDYQGI